MAKKEITYELVVEVNGPDGKPVEQTITKAANSIDTFAIAAEQADKKLKKAPLGSEAFKKAAKASKEATSAFDKAKESSMSFGDKLKAIPGPIGGMIQSVTTLSKTLLASPIGIITLALGALYKAFTSTKKGTEMLQQGMAFLGAALDVLRDLIVPIAETLVGMFTEPKKTLDELYNNVLVPLGNYISDTFTPLINGMKIGFNNLVIGINKARIAYNEFTGDQEEANELMAKNTELTAENDKMTQESIEARERVAATNQMIIDKAKEIVNEIIEEGNQAVASTAKLQQLADAQRALNVERAQQNVLISEAKRQATDETLSFEKRIEALQTASKLEQDLLNKEISLARATLAEKQKLAAQSDSDTATLEEISQLQIQLANLTEQSTNKTKELQDQTKGLTEQKKAAAQASLDIQRGLLDRLEEDERAALQRSIDNQRDADLQAIDNLKDTEEEKAKLRLLAEEDYQQEKVKLQEQFDAEDRAKETEQIDNDIALLEVKNNEDLAQLQAYLTKKKDLELANQDLTDSEIALINKHYNEAFIKSEEELTGFKLAQQQAAADIALQGLDVIKQVFGEESKVGKAAAISQALINTYLGVSQTLADKTLPTIAKVVAVVGMVTSGLKNVQQIKGVKPPAFAEGGMVTGPGNGTSDSITAQVSNGESIINAKSTSMYSPLLSAINQAGGGKRFDSSGAMGSSQGVGNSGSPIIKTYVVANDVTTEQQLYRQQKSRSLV